MTTTTIEYPPVVSRAVWLEARKKLLTKEKGYSVFHTYSIYGRGGETVGGAYYFLDLTALGRQEDWEEPKGRATGLGAQAGSDKMRYPDE